MTHVRSSIAGLAILLLLLGACGGRAPQEDRQAPTGGSALASGERVRSVELVYDGLASDRSQRLEAYGGPELLQSNLERLLRAGGHLDPSGDLELSVSIDSFRLRSSASAFWLGGMAGSDSVTAHVQLVRGDRPIKSFETDTSTILGGIAYASGTRRTRRLMTTLARRIVDGL